VCARITQPRFTLAASPASVTLPRRRTAA